MIRILVILLLWCSPVMATDYCSSAVGCWLFTDTDYNGGAGTTVNDASPNTNTGTFKAAGEPAWNTTDVSFHTSGSAPNSVDFDGVNDYINAGTSSTIENLGSQSATIWFYQNNSATVAERLQDQNIGDGTATFIVAGPGQYVAFGYPYSTTSILRTSETGSYSLGEWNHLTVTWDGTSNASNIKMYINANQVIYVTTTNGVGTQVNFTTGSYRIGNNVDGNRCFDGKIAEHARFSDVIDAFDISAIYDYGLSPTSVLVGGSIIRSGSIIRGGSIIR